MAKYKVPDSVFEERDKTIVLSMVTYYTEKYGFLDTSTVNPTTLVRRFGITKQRAVVALQELLSEGKVEAI